MKVTLSIIPVFCEFTEANFSLIVLFRASPVYSKPNFSKSATMMSSSVRLGPWILTNCFFVIVPVQFPSIPRTVVVILYSPSTVGNTPSITPFTSVPITSYFSV